MDWHPVKDKSQDIPINTNVLITDGYEVYVGFYDSYHEWLLQDQTVCSDIGFHISHWQEFPEPPN